MSFCYSCRPFMPCTVHLLFYFFYHFSANLSPLSLSLSLFHPFLCQNIWMTPSFSLGLHCFKSRTGPPGNWSNLMHRHRKRPRSWRRPSGIVHLEARTRVSEKIVGCTKWWWIWAFGRLWVSWVLVLIGLSSSAVGLMDFECLWVSWILNVLGFEE